MARIFSCGPSNENDRPQIDFEDVENGKNDWLTVGEVLDGAKPVSAFPEVSVRVFHQEATDWDCYMDGGARGLFSQRFVDTVGPGACHGLTLLPAKLNGVTYFFLRCDCPIDCLDRFKASFETFRCDPTVIKYITHFAFREPLLPLDGCFCIPETVALLLTESVVPRLLAAKLKGLHIAPVP